MNIINKESVDKTPIIISKSDINAIRALSGTYATMNIRPKDNYNDVQAAYILDGLIRFLSGLGVTAPFELDKEFYDQSK